MKIRINYDLFEKIREAKGEFSLQKKTVKNILYTWPLPFLASFTMFLATLGNNPTTENIKEILILYGACIGIKDLFDLALHSRNKDFYSNEAKLELSELSYYLIKSLFINTAVDLLLNAEQYGKTTYSFMNKEKLIPRLQKKNILIPTYENSEIKDKIILQEHLLGSNDWYLSVGSPKKEEKLVLRHS